MPILDRRVRDPLRAIVVLTHLEDAADQPPLKLPLFLNGDVRAIEAHRFHSHVVQNRFVPDLLHLDLDAAFRAEFPSAGLGGM